MTAALATLNRAALVALEDCEQRIERGLRTFIEVGAALAAIRDNKLYRGTHETFEAYCRERWNMTPQHANRLALAAGVVTSMEPIGSIEPPTNEGQARALAAVPEAERADVWRETVERTDGKPTAAAVREVAAERNAPAEPERQPLGTPETPGPVDADGAPPADPGATPDLTAGILRALAESSRPQTAGDVADRLPSRVVYVDVVLAELERLADEGLVEPAGRELRLNRFEPLWQLAEREPPTCLGTDMDCGRPLPCPNHPRTPEERIAAVAEVAPEFVQPAPAEPAPTLRIEPTADEKQRAVQRDARALLLRVVELLSPTGGKPDYIETWARKLGPYDDELAALVQRAGDAMAALDDLISEAGK